MTACGHYGQAPDRSARQAAGDGRAGLGRPQRGYLGFVADTPPSPEHLHASTVELRESLAAAFEQTADVLEQSARLADEDAERRALQGESGLAALERRRAEQARAGVRKARANALRLRSARSP